MKLNRRLQALEKGTVRLPSNAAVGLLARACRDDRTPEVELVAQSISSTEPDGAHLLDLARAILNSPNEAGRPGRV
jgi:hypothetical protein